ncbi:MAG: sigma-70 family RNA polymerase sigma factor [Candidatus Omnitrophica bacterium]|nr:sigma-70 family RNA polymerase sigma factor [Candidatus Omnitrophota bacterium]
MLILRVFYSPSQKFALKKVKAKELCEAPLQDCLLRAKQSLASENESWQNFSKDPAIYAVRFILGVNMRQFEDLITKISPKLRAIARKLDGRYTSFDDDDLYQEALFSLWEKYNENKLSDKTDSYILQGCLFFLKNHIRKVYKKIDAKSVSLNAVINEDEGTLEDVLASRCIDPGAGSFECSLLLKDIYAKLSDQEKKVADLSINDTTVREIGKRLGISHVMVVKIRNRIKSKCETIRKEIA